MCVFTVRVTLLRLLLLVMPPENVNTRYQHICDEGNAKDNGRALFLSLSLSLSLYSSSSLVEEENEDGDDFF